MRDSRLTDPPKVDGPIDAADPGLRSNTVDPIVCAGKNTHEWCVGSLVSLNGIPSKVMLYWPSLKPRKNVFVSPRPGPLALTLNVPGAICSTWL